ncbi:MAG: metalloregulator ArsR/SmtB family transcription factor [Acidobacteria bacterium]|nr:metalloregulator ArsR/SmtB family transcription factor [Acidobacteriota bacterium]
MSVKSKRFDLEKFFLALSDRTRLRLLNLMGEDEVCVCFFVEVLKAAQPKISRHLAYLRNAGIVSARREGKWMHYRITEPPDERAAGLLKQILSWLKEDPDLERDREKLMNVCCSPSLPVSLRGAPVPVKIERASAARLK